MKFIKYLIILVALIYFTFFSIDNRHYVTVYLFPYPYELNIPLFLLLILMLCVGVITGKLLHISLLFRYYLNIIKLKRRLDEMEKRVNNTEHLDQVTNKGKLSKKLELYQ